MKKYFITYGDDAFYLSRKQLAKQAQKSGLFDEVIIGPSRKSKERFSSFCYSCKPC